MSCKCFKYLIFYLWRYDIQMFNLLFPSNTLWLAYIDDIQTLTHNSWSKSFQNQRLTPSRQSIFMGGPELSHIMPRRFHEIYTFARIWKKFRMFLIYQEIFLNYWNFLQKNTNWICILDILTKPNAFIS